MSLTQKRRNQIVKEELNRALKKRGLNERMDPNYNDDLQSRLGRFTTPENVKGTPQYGRGPSPARKPEPGIYYPQDYTPPGGYGGGAGGNWDYSEYDHLREADDDMDMDTGIDVVPDDEMGGEEDMGMPMSGEEMEPVATEIDWSQFEDEDTDVVGVAFFDALKQLREESPDEEPTAEAVVALMQELLAGDSEEDMDDMGGEEMEDEAVSEEEESMGGDEEGALNEWVRRTNLLAGTSKRR